ncbi:MAG: hypothetical protein K2P06_01290 [Muribaculaceae bacterium]|nr:hypothetical protein [Muribaculaceae bacterium]
MTKNFNTYIESPAVDCLRSLCLREGVLHHYDRAATACFGKAYTRLYTM